MAKIKRESEEFFHALINFELEKYGTTVSELKKNHPDGMIDGVPWFTHYTFDTALEASEWKAKCKNLCTKDCSPKMSARMFEAAWPMFSLTYGLKSNYDIFKKD